MLELEIRSRGVARRDRIHKNLVTHPHGGEIDVASWPPTTATSPVGPTGQCATG
jgi:hypothetical protein